MGRKYFLLVVSVISVLLFGLSIAGNIQAQPQQCTTDADCNDGLFCNGTETCLNGSCVAVSACPPYVDGCVIRGSICDEINDQCMDFADDSRCSAGQICDVITGLCLEGTSCSLAQQAAQDAVASGGTYKNHGQMVKTAAHAANPFLEEGVISEECHSCIVSQFARGIPIVEQEYCGPTVLCPCFDASDIQGQGIDFMAQVFIERYPCAINWPDVRVELAGFREEGANGNLQLFWDAGITRVSVNPPSCFLYDGMYGIDIDYFGLSDAEAAACVQILINSQMFQLNNCPPE